MVVPQVPDVEESQGMSSKDAVLLKDSMDSPSGSDNDVCIDLNRDAQEEPLLVQAAPADASIHQESQALRIQIGMACYAISSFFFAMMAVVVKLAGQQGVPIWEIVFIRSSIVMAFSLPQILHAGENPFGNRRWLLSFRGLTGCCSVSSLFFAVQLIPIADMAVFTFLTPVFVALASPFALKETLAKGSLLCCAMCMLGVVLVAQPPFLFDNGRLSVAAVAVALIHPVSSACAKASIRVLTRTESNNVIVFYLSLFTMTGSFLAMCIIPGQFRPLKSYYELFLVVASGVCGYGTQSFMNIGLRRVKAAQAMTMAYLGIVWSGVAGVLVFREYPNFYSGVGDAIIITSTLLFALRSTGVFDKKRPPVDRSDRVDEPLLAERIAPENPALERRPDRV